VWPVKKADVCLTGNHLPKYIFLLVIAYWFVCMFMKPIPRPKFSVTSEGSSSTREGVNLPPQLSRKSNTKNKLIVKLMLTWLTVVIRMLERGKPGTQWRQSRQSQKKNRRLLSPICRRFVRLCRPCRDRHCRQSWTWSIQWRRQKFLPAGALPGHYNL